MQMRNGEQIFFEVVEGMTRHTQTFLAAMGTDLSQIDYLIPHQANGLILREVARRLQLPPEKMLIQLGEVGNTSSASIPLLLSSWRERLQPGKTALLVAVGAGHTLGLGLLKL
ncbi:MAG: hypothetical protein IGS03_06535 [Candidatus Sericytochromatia bacterium]|nr:hypothetical protein [Candidatus Sericytochromatia bacterium]